MFLWDRRSPSLGHFSDATDAPSVIVYSRTVVLPPGKLAQKTNIVPPL